MTWEPAAGSDRTFQGDRPRASSGVAARARTAAEQTSRTARQYPVAAVLTVFGLGLGLGAALGAALAGPSRAERDEQNAMERFGREALHAVAGVLPESVTRRFRV